VTTDATREHCIDAELMAAWADGGLPADDAERVELHLSNCERCQEVLAAFMRSQPAAAAVLPFWARPVVRWSTAGLAAAAAVMLMVWTGQPPATGPETTMASRQSVPAPPPPPAPDAAGQAMAGVPKDEAPASTAKKTESAPARAVAAPPPPPPPSATFAKPMGSAANAAAVADSAREEKVAAESVADVVIVAPDPQEIAKRQAAAATGGGGGRGGAVGLAAGRTALRETGSPVPARWRVLTGAKVERSLDGGATWTTANVAPGPPVIITAGSAASQQVCWLVGRSGAVFISKDGVLFERVSAPDPGDLQSVQAADALNATVKTEDDRTFTTSDGGVTWVRK
jgi:hypothetical protein